MAERDLAARDQEVIWHPYTQMQNMKPAIAIVRGTGAYLFDDQGNQYLDAISSWWVNIHGHAHPYIAAKVSEQLSVLEHVIFAGFTHPGAVLLAERLLKIIPQSQKKVFYSDNGSTAVEVALKMCFQYWSNSGRPRLKVLAFQNSYHGDTFGAMSVSARSAFTLAFEKLLFEVVYIDLPGSDNLQDLKDVISEHKADTACFIFEPLVQGAGGMQMYQAELLNELMAHCRLEGILTIADEVMTGFGRTGKLFASQHVKEQPDIMCFSKGLTGGTMALGITTCSEKIYNAFLSEDKLKTLFHGHSFTANPLACASALASMDLLLSDACQNDIKRICSRHLEFERRIQNHNRVKEIRRCGTIIAIEWQNEEGSSYFHNLRDKLYDFFIGQGIILRPLGNIIYILPPYCISNDELDYVYKKIEEALGLF